MTSENSKCTVCAALAGLNLDAPAGTYPHVELGNMLGVSEASIRRHYIHMATAGESVLLPLREKTSGKSDGTRGVEAFEGIRDRPVTMKDVREWVRASGDDPEDFTLSMSSSAYGKDTYSNKMSAVPKNKRAAAQDAPVAEFIDDFNPEKILATLRGASFRRPSPVKDYGDGTFVVSFNDTQFGKAEGGGTPATLKRLNAIIESVIVRINELRVIGRELGTLVIIGGGDIIEGCVIFGNQSFNIDLDRRGQINTAVTSILDLIDRLAPMFHKVVVLAARGNHGENRIDGRKTTLYDNDDTMVFEMARLATDRDPELQHVEYIIAESEAAVWVDTSGWRLATTHGDIYAKGVQGTSIDKKAQNWYKNMAMTREPVGSADVLITHHFHHEKSSDWGACEWHQSPALDGGSEWFRQSSGEYSISGMLTFAMYPSTRYSDELVVREY